MNDKLIYACPWNKDRTTSWSGTHFSLYNALSNYFDVIDYPIKKNLFQKVKSKLTKDMDISLVKKVKMNVTNETPILQFSEAPYSVNHHQYVYQDLSVGHLKYLAENDTKIFSTTGFQNFSLDTLTKRNKLQEEFYLSDNCAGIFTMCKWLAKFLVEHQHIPANKVFHVGGGINLDVSKIDLKNKQSNTFIFIGKDFNRKNGPLVLEAFKLLKKKIPNIKLNIVGPSNLDIIEDGVNYYGTLSFEEEIKIINESDVMVMPSLFEAYGLVFVEALTYGLPCIGRNAYEMPYFIEENKTGYLLKNQSIEELSILMEQAITNTNMKDNVIKNHEYYKKEYSWDTVASRIAEVIKRS